MRNYQLNALLMHDRKKNVSVIGGGYTGCQYSRISVDRCLSHATLTLPFQQDLIIICSLSITWMLFHSGFPPLDVHALSGRSDFLRKRSLLFSRLRSALKHQTKTIISSIQNLLNKTPASMSHIRINQINTSKITVTDNLMWVLKP